MSAPEVVELLTGRSLRAVEYRCRERRGSPALPEAHGVFTIAFVRKGCFSYCTEGQRHELVAGSILLGAPGREYRCLHDHVAGDVCVSFAPSSALLDQLAGARLARLWSAATLPPLERLIVLGARASAWADGAREASLEELGFELTGRVIETLADRRLTSEAEPTPSDRRRAIRACELIETEYGRRLELEALAGAVELSPFHFLRLFKRVAGVTPHQYLMRVRLFAAAQMLAAEDRPITDIALDVGFGDLSTFVRTFRRAAGVSPQAFRKQTRDRSKISQVRSLRRR